MTRTTARTEPRTTPRTTMRRTTKTTQQNEEDDEEHTENDEDDEHEWHEHQGVRSDHEEEEENELNEDAGDVDGLDDAGDDSVERAVVFSESLWGSPSSARLSVSRPGRLLERRQRHISSGGLSHVPRGAVACARSSGPWSTPASTHLRGPCPQRLRMHARARPRPMSECMRTALWQIMHIHII